jgi:hypothetical protein
MFHDTDHPDVSISDWRKFLTEIPPHLIAEIIDRSEAKLPDCFVPLARGVSIASDALLRMVGHQHGMNRPRGWHKLGYTFMRMTGETDKGLQDLRVRECGKLRLWTVERWNEKRPYQDFDEILVHEFGSTPIFTRSYQSAMRLAMYCHENGPPAGLRWIYACPGKDAVEFARERRLDEALVCRNAHQEDYLRGAA